MFNVEEAIERAKQQGLEAAQEDLVTGNDRSGDDTIADTEALVLRLTGQKLHEVDEDIIIAIVEAHDEMYIETYVAGQV